MTRPHAPALLLLALVFSATCNQAAAQAIERLSQLPSGLMDGPDPMPALPPDPGPAPVGSADNEAEELAAPRSDAASDMDEAEASRLVNYNSMQNPWLPICDQDIPGWQPELPIPLACLDCECDGKLPGEACTLWRSFQKPTHPSIDQQCVVCVKEPCLGYEKAHYTVDAVVQKCFEHQECFRDKECADGRCIEKEGTKTVKQLHPCKAKVKLMYWKPIVKYRDVYYYINCEPCNAGDTAVAQR